MRSRYRIREPLTAQFVTSTIVAWLPVFTSSARCDVLIRSWQYCREHKGLRIHAWIIFDNHFHAILSAPDLLQVMRDFKRHTAKAILQVEEKNCTWLLRQFEYFHAAHKSHTERVWQEDFHPLAICTEETMLQKLEYLHGNPVKRGLVAAPTTGATRPPTSDAKMRSPSCAATRGGEDLHPHGTPARSEALLRSALVGTPLVPKHRFGMPLPGKLCFAADRLTRRGRSSSQPRRIPPLRTPAAVAPRPAAHFEALQTLLPNTLPV